MCAIITIEADTKTIDRRLKILSAGVKDFKKPLKESGLFSVKLFRENFDVVGAKFKKWKALSPATIRAKARAGFPMDPLIATGRMQNSFKLFKLERLFVSIGNPVAYFKYHQSSSPRTRLPRRVMISTNATMIKTISKNFTDYLKALLKK